MRTTANALLVATESFNAMLRAMVAEGGPNVEAGVIKMALDEAQVEIEAFLDDEDPKHINNARGALEKAKSILGV